MDYKIAPIPDNEPERLAALRAAMCAYVPREDRFDRITRMAQRMMHVPIALISIVEEDVQWFRSAQGLSTPQTARSESFCGHAIMFDDSFFVPDTHADPRFARNPLVIGPPHVRSYCGWPLQLAPGLRVGTLCVLDTMPRTYSSEDQEIMADLARMAESEIRADSLSDQQKRLLQESSIQRRQQLLDPNTGAWSERGFCELMRRTLRDVHEGKAFAALCAINIHNVEDFNVGEGQVGAHELRAALISQFIRQRLPSNAVLCRMAGGRACVMFGARDNSLLREQVATFLQSEGHRPIAGIAFSHQLSISSAVLSLKPEYVADDPEVLLDAVMARLTENIGNTSILT
ncbi:MAG: GAF domain-containing protein [Burkholderiales bacterium]|nr:MAG: GAF domain-containing protein [Burkholderiales bacterium]